MTVAAFGGATLANPWSVQASTAILQPKRVVGQTSFADDTGQDPANPSARASVDSIVQSAPVRDTAESAQLRAARHSDHTFEIII